MNEEQEFDAILESKSSEEMEFLHELIGVYESNRSLIDRELGMKCGQEGILEGEERILDFCHGITGDFSYENICKLALVFANILGERMPDHIHARMILGTPNASVAQYAKYTDSLKPRMFGLFRMNPNHFKKQTLGKNGEMIKSNKNQIA